MNQITAFTDDAIQQITLVLPDGSTVPMTLNYIPAQQGWFYSITYGSAGWGVSNRRIVNSPNMLREFRNIIPFGFCCTTIDGYEIINQSDFVSGRVNFYLLDPTDLMQTEILITETLPNFVNYPLN